MHNLSGVNKSFNKILHVHVFAGSLMNKIVIVGDAKKTKTSPHKYTDNCSIWWLDYHP